jgi:hypothetical protein
VGLTWRLKETLPAARHVYYGKLLRGRPVLVALDLFPAFYALVRGRQRAAAYQEEYAAGRMTHTARRLMDALARERPQYTRDLRASCFMLEPAKTREFERAMGELQQGLWVVKTEERYEPTFSYRVGPAGALAAGAGGRGPAAVAGGGRRPARRALSRRGDLRARADAGPALRAPARRGARGRGTAGASGNRGVADAPVSGLAGAWVVHASAR